MTKCLKFFSFGIWISFVIGILTFGFSNAFAQQSPEVLLTWKSTSYVPSDYLGKALPSDGSRVNVSVLAIEKNRLVDLSKTEIRWSINNEPVELGVGMTDFTFTMDRLQGDHLIRASLTRYKGGNADIHKNVNIPLADPEAVIDSPNHNDVIVPALHPFAALLYFFNISNISQINFNWTANDETAPFSFDNPDKIAIDAKNLTSNAFLNLQVVVQNTLRTLEVATQSLTLTVK